MLFRTDMSIGISNASPPSLTHGCAGNIEFVDATQIRVWL